MQTPRENANWLADWMSLHEVALWGAADLRGFDTPTDDVGTPFPRAVSMVFPLTPAIMAGIQNGPNQAYADEYTRVNQRIDALSAQLAAAFGDRGWRARALAASARTDPVNIRGDFPHKTAATRAGLGWIGRHCQLITRRYGSWVRLGSVFTDAALATGPPSERSFCGRCTRCVAACPAGALSGEAWHPGVARERILDVDACDQWKKTHYRQYRDGHTCGICSAVCPYGLKVLKREAMGFRPSPGRARRPAAGR
ncbi:MAG: 4Fe-4S double cluster binding domain-containing protein [Desulfobacteraceae bacterium]|jgi:epoxyqueuosine reductase QueG|nr:4Fe-4S double cluster binding domain-containing protein [Desulfobacteraceae bacterium]